MDTKVFHRARFAISSPSAAAAAAAAAASAPGLDEDQHKLREKLPPVVGATPDQREIHAAHAEQLSKRYELEGGKGSVQAVHSTSLGVLPNTITGLLGPNGAGKSTMVSMMSGVEKIDSGNSWIQQSSIVSESANARRMLGLW